MKIGAFVPQGWRMDLNGVAQDKQWQTILEAANKIEKVQKEAIKADDDREREKIKNEQRQKKLEQRNQLAFIGFNQFQEIYSVRKILGRIEYHLY